MIDRVVDGQFAQPANYLERFKACARLAIAAGADAIIPAEAVVAAIVGINGLPAVDGVPVVDSLEIPLLGAEHRVTLAQRVGPQVSHDRAYALPSVASVEAVFGTIPRD